MYKGTRLASAASAYAPPLFLPAPKFKGKKTLFGGVLEEWLSNIPIGAKLAGAEGAGAPVVFLVS